MGILLYSNGITEDYVAKSVSFSEKELISIFDEFRSIKTKRLISVLNTWCVWGENENLDIVELNRIASDITQEPIYSIILFIHDSELNPKWNTTDNILYRSYPEFLTDIKRIIDETANQIIEDFRNYEDENTAKTLPVLDAVGSTQDKRIIFLFNPDNQNEEFYENAEFLGFSKKAYDYMKSHTQNEEPFTIFADKKAIIIVDAANVTTFMDRLLEKFKNEEHYEICNELTTMISTWNDSRTTKKSKSDKSSEI